MITCSKCNNKSRTGSHFCNYCGFKFERQVNLNSPAENKLVEGFVPYRLANVMTIQYPENWMIRDRKSNPDLAAGLHVLFKPPVTIADSGNTFLAVGCIKQDIQILLSKVPLPDILNIIAENIAQSKNDPSFHIGESSPTTVNGILAHRLLEYDNHTKRLRIFFIRTDDEIWTLDYLTTVNAYQLYLPLVEKIINSLRLISPPEIISNIDATTESSTRYNSINASNEPLINVENNREAQTIGYANAIELSIADIDPQERLAKSVEILNSSPTNALAWNSKGRALQELQRFDEALLAFNTALEIEPKCYLALVSKGQLLSYQKKEEEAIRCYADAIEYSDSALSENPDDFGAWFAKADALSHLERYENAAECYNKAIALSPNFSHLWSSKGFALNELKEYYAALKCYDKATELNPKDVTTWNNKAFVYGLLEKFDDELECHDKVLQMEPENVQTWWNKAFVLAGIERFNEALECYNKAIGLEPNNSELWNGKGLTLLAIEKYTNAITCFDEAIRLNPNYTDAIYNKGSTSIRIGLLDEGFVNLQKSIELGGSEYKEMVTEDDFLDSVKDDERYKELIN